jgi:hypothetical protein
MGFGLLIFSAEGDRRFRLEFPVIGELNIVAVSVMIGG